MAGGTRLLLRKLIAGRDVASSIILRRSASTLQNKSDREFKEVEIPVPWGKIAGKHWGPPDIPPIIALHGWQDNAGSFDPLVKDLPADLSILAVDSPGHGFSSWLPQGMVYSNLLYIQMLERIKHHYKMDQIGLIGHSMGGILSFNYAAIFPQTVKFVVAFDYFKYPTYPCETMIPVFIKDWGTYFKIEQSTASAPRHSEEEAIKRYIKGTNNSLNEEMCRTLMVRGATKHPDGTVSFNRDPRVQLFLLDSGFSHEQLLTLASRITCPYSVIKGEHSRHIEKKKFYFDVLKVIEDHSPDFAFHTVPGTHHFHMSHTKGLADLIGPFLKKYV